MKEGLPPDWDVDGFPKWKWEYYTAQHNLVWFHCTKCAMTAIRTSVQDMRRVPLDSIPDNARTFAVVRNPLDRAISGFLYIKKIGKRPNYEIRHLDDALFESFWQKPCREMVDAYLDELVANGPWDTHNVSQCHFLNGGMPQHRLRRIKNVDIFVRMDNLNPGLRQLCPGVKLGRRKVSEPHEKEMVTPWFVRRKREIEELYRADMDLYERVTSRFWPAFARLQRFITRRCKW